MTVLDMIMNNILDISIIISSVILIISFFITIFYFTRMSDLYSKILALDVLAIIGLGFICLYAIITGSYFYVDVAIALSLIAFLATVAFARYTLKQKDKKTE